MKILQERGVVAVAPGDCQFGVPTSRPRQEGRAGQQIDIMACKGLHAKETHIHIDSYMKAGTDHELLQGCFTSVWKSTKQRRSTRPRVVSKQFGTITHVDQ